MLRLARPLGTAARRHMLSRPLLTQTRGYAERNDSMLSSDPSFKGDKSPSTPAATPPVPTPATPASTTSIPPEKIPKVPPPSPLGQTQTAPPTDSSKVSPPPTTTPPLTSPIPPPPKKSRGPRLALWLILVSALGYGGAVLLALNNDNFHDFFTEYVPFGEDIVLYFEEQSFHRRFPQARMDNFRTTREPRDEGKQITIPHRSGLSWKLAEEEKPKDGSDVTTKGKHMSAVGDHGKGGVSETQQDPGKTTQKDKVAAVEAAKKDDTSAKTSTGKAQPQTLSSQDVKPPSPSKPSTSSSASSSPSRPKSDASPPAAPVTAAAAAPVSKISNVEVPNAEEPVVQELVKILNDLITVVNSDSPDKFSAPMQKAKDAFHQVAGKISALRDAERGAAEERLKQANKEFDEAAKGWVERMETAKKEDDMKYREEFEAERSKIAGQYENRLQAEIERTKELLQQQHKNELSEQGLKLKRKFIDDVQSLVESERDGRLSKLSNLSLNVDDLTQLTSNWNGIIDANLATQKLQVAVDAVRSALDDANGTHKPTPFVREMAALKLVAENDPIVDAAVASINPSAYQKGIPSPAQLIDRFRKVASEVRKASLLPEDAGVASHAASMVLSRVMFKKQGIPQGNDVESILTRTETLLEEGDLDNAAREMNGLQGWANVLSRDWLNDARKVLEVQQALEVIETEARLQCLRVS